MLSKIVPLAILSLYISQELHTDILLEEIRGKQQPAVHVFAMSLRYMKEHLLRAMKTNLEFDPDPLTIRWVLTVPAIWDENSKQFMREAAHRVSILLFECCLSSLFVLYLFTLSPQIHRCCI